MNKFALCKIKLHLSQFSKAVCAQWDCLNNRFRKKINPSTLSSSSKEGIYKNVQSACSSGNYSLSRKWWAKGTKLKGRGSWISNSGTLCVVEEPCLTEIWFTACSLKFWLLARGELKHCIHDQGRFLNMTECKNTISWNKNLLHFGLQLLVDRTPTTYNSTFMN